MVLAMVLIGYLSYQYWQKNQNIAKFTSQFNTAVSNMNIEELNELQDFYSKSELKSDFKTVVVSEKQAMLDQFESKLNSDQYDEAISWISTIWLWYGDEGINLVVPIIEDFFVESLNAYDEIDMIALTDSNRELFLRQVNDKLAAITSRKEVMEILNVPSMMEGVVEKWKNDISSYRSFLNYSRVEYHIKAYRLETLQKYMLEAVEVKPFESQLEVTNVDGVLSLNVPVDEKLFVLTLDEAKNMSHVGEYIIEGNEFKEKTIDLNDKGIFYIISTNSNYQPAEDIRVFYGKLDFSNYIYMDEAYQDIKKIALEEMEKYRGLIEPILISGYVFNYKDQKMLVSLNYLDTLIDYDLEPFVMNIVDSIDYRQSDSYYTAGTATGYSQINLVYNDDRAHFSSVFHHEMMHVIEAFERSVKCSNRDTYAEVEEEYDRLVQIKKDVFSLLKGEYLEDLILSESETENELKRILSIKTPFTYGVVSGYSLFSRDEDTAEIWATMTSNPELIEKAIKSNDIFKNKIEYTLDVINYVKSLNGDHTKYDFEFVKNHF